WVEIFRPDAWAIAAIPAAQIFALLLMAAALVFLFMRHRDWQPPETWYAERASASSLLPPATPTVDAVTADSED
ncbi:MAG: hypothetical protein WAU95_18865, partial [Anaerolineae bacterium]